MEVGFQKIKELPLTQSGSLSFPTKVQVTPDFVGPRIVRDGTRVGGSTPDI